jgi:hypothetical protein
MSTVSSGGNSSCIDMLAGQPLLYTWSYVGKDTETEREYVHEKAVLTILKDRRRHMKRETEERTS